MKSEINKDLFLDSMDRPLTQSLFLEIGYRTEFAVYTLGERDKHYKGRTYPSLKRIFLEHEDPTEYDFATEHLLGWQHWKRLNENKALTKYFQEWREELELKMRSQAVRDIIDFSAQDKGFQAAKWIADRGWEKRGAGRPSKTEKLKEERILDKIEDEFSADIIRLNAGK